MKRQVVVRSAHATLAGVRRVSPPAALAVVVAFRVAVAAVVGAGIIIGLSIGWVRPRSAIQSKDGLKAAAIGVGALVIGWVIVAQILTQVIAGTTQHVAAWVILAVIVAGLAWLGMRKLEWKLTPERQGKAISAVTGEQAKIAEALAGRLSGVSDDMLEVSKLVRVFTDVGTTGRRFTVKLPLWIEASQVAANRGVIASAIGGNCKADRITVTEGSTPNQALVHVADKSPSELPPSPWPLTGATSFDVCKPIPIGTTPDGKTAHLQLFDRDARGDLQSYHLLLTGMSRYGKSSLLQLILSACALDDRAVLDVTVLGQHTRDFEDIAPALSFLTVNASLEDLHAQLDRGLARMASKIRTPYVLVIDEAQIHLGGKDGDAAARRKLRDLLSSAGKAGISVIIVTQDPIADNLAPDLARRPQNRVSFRQPQDESARRAMGSGMTPDTDPSKFGGGDKGKGLAAVISEDGFHGRVKTPLIHEDVVKRIANDHRREPVEAEFPLLALDHDNAVQDPEPAPETIVDHVATVWPDDRPRVILCADLVGMLTDRFPQYDGLDVKGMNAGLRKCGLEPRKGAKVGDQSGYGVYWEDLEAVRGGVVR